MSYSVLTSLYCIFITKNSLTLFGWSLLQLKKTGGRLNFMSDNDETW